MSSVYDTPEWAAWLASIREMPDDDNRRLVAADFLEENGEGERAEFIRVQVALCKWEQLSLQNHYTNALRDIQKTLPRLQRNDIDRISQKAWIEGNKRHQEYQERWKTLRRREFNLLADHGRRWAGWNAFRVLPAPLSSPLPAGKDEVEFTRGFIARVSGPLSSLIGEKCRHCEGGYFGYPRSGVSDCPVCDATGYRTPGVLRELVKREPVGFVEATDKEPWPGNVALLRYWSWVDAMDESANPNHYLPSSLFRHLEWCESDIWRNATVKAYQSPDAARAALSAAILRLVQPVDVPT